MSALLADGMAERAAPVSINGLCQAVARETSRGAIGIQSALRLGVFVYRAAKYEPRT
jgi:hypothetical protein